jgi:hypothetical protein
MNIRIFICLVLVLIFNIGFAQTIRVDVNIDTTLMTAGDRTVLHLKLPPVQGLTPGEVNTAELDSVKGIEVIGKTNWQVVKKDNFISYLEMKIPIQAWDTGYYRIPALTVGFELNGKMGTSQTFPIPIRVIQPTGVDSMAQIQPIKGIVEEKFQFEDAIPYLIALVSLILFSAIAYLIYGRYKNKDKQPITQIIKLAPDVLAANQLAELERKQLWQSGQVKEYHSELTYIIREYIEERFQVPALESTTDDLMVDIRKKTSLQAGLYTDLKEMLETADLVKFAKVVPSEEVHTHAYDLARNWVAKTKPVAISPQP